jgi:monoamine oxidase
VSDTRRAVKGGERADVVIIGAGAAGIAAANRLTKAGRRVVIVEARDRIGGRIHTIRDPRFTIPVELGAEFIHGRNVETWEILRAMPSGGAAYFADGHHRHFRNGRLKEMDDFWDEVDKVFSRLDAVDRNNDMSFRGFLKKHCRGLRLRNARKLALSFVEGFDAADANRISAYSIRQAEDASGDGVEGAESYRLVGGYVGVLEHIHNDSPHEKLTLRLNTIVNAIRWKKGAVEVVTSGGTIRAKQAIVTVPVGVLNDGSIRFEPDLLEKRDAAARIAMGGVVKTLLRFREPFWESRPLPAAGEKLPNVVFLTSDPSANAAVPTWWTYYPVRDRTLVGWAGGPAAMKLSHRSADEVLRDAIAALATITGVATRQLKSMLVGSHVADWQADPLSRGAYSYVTVGNIEAPKRLAQPVDRTLFFAGEATASNGIGGTVDAALTSGWRAADEILGKPRQSRR